MNNQKQTLTASPTVICPSKIKPPTPKDQIISADGANRLLQNLLDHSRNKHLNERILKQVMARIPNLQPNRAYTLRQICGEKFWWQLEDGEAREAGVWIASVVTRKLLPLSLGNKNGSNHRTYYLN